MENQKRNTENAEQGKQQESGKDRDMNDSGHDNVNAKRTAVDDAFDTENTDKYLAMEQPGVSYTPDSDPMALNSDHADFGEIARKREWNDEGGNSKNSDAFNQDDYLLDDNIDLDEDQNKSISSDDEDFEEANERY